MGKRRNRWISCDDIMPQDFYDKELKDSDGNILIGYWRPDANAWDHDEDGWIEADIVEWRNLPLH